MQFWHHAWFNTHAHDSHSSRRIRANVDQFIVLLVTGHQLCVVQMVTENILPRINWLRRIVTAYLFVP